MQGYDKNPLRRVFCCLTTDKFLSARAVSPALCVCLRTAGRRTNELFESDCAVIGRVQASGLEGPT